MGRAGHGGFEDGLVRDAVGRRAGEGEYGEGVLVGTAGRRDFFLFGVRVRVRVGFGGGCGGGGRRGRLEAAEGLTSARGGRPGAGSPSRRQRGFACYRSGRRRRQKWGGVEGGRGMTVVRRDDGRGQDRTQYSLPHDTPHIFFLTLSLSLFDFSSPEIPAAVCLALAKGTLTKAARARGVNSGCWFRLRCSGLYERGGGGGSGGSGHQ
mmetsp:Transcript_21858/g.64520  ORF Transcript_21858/g.64520 Transcript_21858/m.64520 type:complete len:208 (+) Transcript_21858:1590-2213(+)